MSTEKKQETTKVITCQECGKIKGKGEIGTHWICEDCKVQPTR